jgi:hypothetical protein
LRPKTSLSDLERALWEGAISMKNVALKAVSRFNTFDKMSYGYIGAGN